jgi:hypothetical protein
MTWVTYMSLVGANPPLPMDEPSQGDRLSKAVAAIAAYDPYAALRFVREITGCSGDPEHFVESCVVREAGRGEHVS